MNALLCYAAEDDEAEGGAIGRFRAELERRVRFVTGRDDVEVFAERDTISWEALWRRTVDGAPDECGVLVPILTPRFLADPDCRAELEQFLARERAAGGEDLVAPVLWYPVDGLGGADGGVGSAGDRLLADLARRPLVAWHEHRYGPEDSPSARRHLDELAQRIKAGLDGGPPPSPQRTVTVNPVLGLADHTTIGSAIAAAGTGDRILVAAGAYEEGLLIDRPVEIVGDGPVVDVVVRARGCDAVLMATAVARIANLTVHQAGGGDWYGIDASEGRLLVEDCVVASDSLAGIGIGDGADPVIRRNLIANNASGGILVHDDALGTIEDNDIGDNTLTGIEVTSGSDPIVVRNRIRGNQMGGVYIHHAALARIEHNEIVGNGDVGVEVELGADPIVRHNRITGNAGYGIWLHDRASITLAGNTLSANRPGDVSIDDDCTVVDEDHPADSPS